MIPVAKPEPKPVDVCDVVETILYWNAIEGVEEPFEDVLRKAREVVAGPRA